jgi:hypothetical protein
VDTPDLVQIWKAYVACSSVISHATLTYSWLEPVVLMLFETPATAPPDSGLGPHKSDRSIPLPKSQKSAQQ